MTPWRVGLWCAVSSRPQAGEEKESLPAQERAGYDFARAVGGEVIRVYSVPGHSRDYVFWHEAEKEMPAYLQVREDLEAGRLDVIHCLDSDRLGRDPALIQTFYSLAERHGCEIYDASMPHPLGQAHLGHRYGVAVKSVSAGEDQRRRVARHATGIRGRVKRGLPPLSRWPIGYAEVRNEQGKCAGAQFDAHIGAIQLITDLFLAGQSYLTILQQLWASGWRLPDGRHWYDSLIWRTCNNDIYAGYCHWGGARNSEPSPHFPALWDAQTYAAILRERERRSTLYNHPRGGPLNGVVFCARCGRRMGRVKSRRPSVYYLRCSKHTAKTRNPEGIGCHPNHILESDILGALSTWLEQFTTPELLDEALRQDTGLAALEKERLHLLTSAEDLEQRRRRLALALAAGQMDPAIYHATDRELAEEYAESQKRLGELHTLIASRPAPEERRAHLEELIAARVGKRSEAVFLGALRKAGVRIYCQDRQVVLIGFVL